MIRHILAIIASAMIATSAYAGGVPNPSNIDTLPGSGLTNNDFVLGSSIQGLKDASFATVPVTKGGTGLTSGTSGGILGFTASATLTSSAALTAHAITIGGGAGATPYPLASLGSTHTLLHGGAGDPTWGAVDLATETTGTLPSGSCPLPTGVTLGCVYAPGNPPVAHNWLTGYNGTTWLTAQPDYTDITGLGTAATYNVGTIGSTIPLLSGSNQWSAVQLFAQGTACSAPGISFNGGSSAGLAGDVPGSGVDICAGGFLRGDFVSSATGSPIIFGNNAANVISTSIGGSLNGIENIGTTTQYGGYRTLSLKNTAAGAPFFVMAHSRSATNGSFSALLNNDQLGIIQFAGDDGASYNTIGAEWVGLSKATWTTGIGPSQMSLGLMNNAGSMVQVGCWDADSGWWNATGSPTAVCAGSNFLDRSNNLTVATAVVGTTTSLAQLVVNSTYTANPQDILFGGTLNNSTTTNQYGIFDQQTINPSGASLATMFGVAIEPRISASATIGMTNFIGNASEIITNAGYPGTIANGYDFYAFGGAALGTNPYTLFAQYYAAGNTNGNGITSGTVTNYGYRYTASTAAAASGGTVINYGYSSNVPTGSGAGTTSNYGVRVTGNGGTGGSGTTVNWAYYSSSTAASSLLGSLRIGSNVAPVYTLDVTGDINGTTLRKGGVSTDLLYAPVTSGSSILSGNGSGGFTNVTIGTGLNFSSPTLSCIGATSVLSGCMFAPANPPVAHQFLSGYNGATWLTAQVDYSDTTGFGTAATQNMGTSGANVPLLNGANTWSATQTFSSSVHNSGSTFIDADFYWTNNITPPLITSNQDNYAPTGNTTAVIFRLSGDATPRTITGLAGGANGRIVMFVNVGLNPVIIAQENAGSTAANRFELGTSTDIVLTVDDTMSFVYDSTLTRWIWISSQIPGPGPSQLGGINSSNCVTHNWVVGYAQSGSPTCAQPGYADITGLGTAAAVNTGTSGTAIPLLSGNNQWSADQIFALGSCSLPGVSLGSPGDTGFFNYGVSDDIGMCAAAHLRAVFYGSASGSPVVFANTTGFIAPTSIGGSNNGIENIGTGSQFGVYRSITFNSSSNQSSRIVLAHSKSATNGSFSALAANDQLGYIAFAGDDGASYDTVGAEWIAISKATWTTGIGPSQMTLGLMNNAGTIVSTACFDADTGWWNSTGSPNACNGNNFLDRSNNASFASLALTTPLPITSGGTGATTSYGVLTNLGDPLPNYLENPSFDVWQENTSYTPNTGTMTFVADRWKVRTSSTATNGTRTFSRVAGFSGSQYALKVQRNASNTETGLITIGQQIYSADAIPLQGKTLHMACDFTLGANASFTTITARLYNGTGIDEAINWGSGFATGGSNSNFSSVYTVVAGATVHVDFGTATASGSETELAVSFFTNAFSGTAGADDSYSVTNCNFTVSTGNVPFVKPSIESEQMQSQFTYRKSFTYATVPVQNAGALTGETLWPATVTTTGTNKYSVLFGRSMRANPTITFYDPATATANCRDETAAVDGGAASSSNITEKGFFISCTGNAASAVNNTFGVHWVADARL